MSEGGKWINGGSTGFDWNNARSTPGKAFGSVIVGGYNDDIAILNLSFQANQYAQGTVFRAASYSPSGNHEIELLLHFKISAHSARGYEVLWAHDGGICAVRWNGPLNDYTELACATVTPAQEGDILRAEITDGVIQVFKNGALVLTTPRDTQWTDGSPGMGFWPTDRGGVVPSNYGWKHYEAGNLSSGQKTFATNLSGTENPLSENGAWTGGATTGLDWMNVRKTPGLAYATGVNYGYDDSIAHLGGFAANHYAQATVHVASNYTAGSSHEVELLLRFKITAHSARGYEINCGWAGAYSEIVRWNGALGDFTVLSTTGPGFGALAEGDVIRATAIGSTITVYKNGVQVMQAMDSTWFDGNPGMGFFVRPDAASIPQNYGFKSFSAGDL